MNAAFTTYVATEQAISPWSGFKTGLWQKESMFAISSNKTMNRTRATTLSWWPQRTASLGNVERVDVLPFHQIGRLKWKQLGLNYNLYDAQPLSLELVGRACAQFRAEGLKAC